MDGESVSYGLLHFQSIISRRRWKKNKTGNEVEDLDNRLEDVSSRRLLTLLHIPKPLIFSLFYWFGNVMEERKSWVPYQLTFLWLEIITAASLLFLSMSGNNSRVTDMTMSHFKKEKERKWVAHGVNVVPKIGICYLQIVKQQETYPEGSIIPDPWAVTLSWDSSCRNKSLMDESQRSVALMVHIMQALTGKRKEFGNCQPLASMNHDLFSMPGNCLWFC